MLSIGTRLLNPHLLDTGEERGGFDAEEFGGAVCAVNFPVGLFERRFNVGLFPAAHFVFRDYLTGYFGFFLG